MIGAIIGDLAAWSSFWSDLLSSLEIILPSREALSLRGRLHLFIGILLWICTFLTLRITADAEGCREGGPLCFPIEGRGFVLRCAVSIGRKPHSPSTLVLVLPSYHWHRPLPSLDLHEHYEDRKLPQWFFLCSTSLASDTLHWTSHHAARLSRLALSEAGFLFIFILLPSPKTTTEIKAARHKRTTAVIFPLHDVPFCLSIRFPLLRLLYFSFAKIAQPVPCKYRCWNRFIHISLHKISTRFPHFLLYARWWLNKMWFFKIFLDIPCISHFPLLAPICT